jgi:hypothetical protein
MQQFGGIAKNYVPKWERSIVGCEDEKRKKYKNKPESNFLYRTPVLRDR